jgi:hypothetical protein
MCPMLIFEGPGNDEFHLDSRLMVARCGSEPSNTPDTYYFLWDGRRFRQLLFVAGKRSAQ